MVSLALVSPKRMEIHVAGCRDLSNRRRLDGDRVSTYGGETLADAIVALDTELAAWFGQQPYSDGAQREGCWAVGNGCPWAPCFERLLRSSGLTFDPSSGRPQARETDRQ